MKKNMGKVDRAVRALVAAVLIVLYAAGAIQGTFGLIAIAVAAAFLLTSFISFCPLYRPLGITTLRKRTTVKTK